MDSVPKCSCFDSFWSALQMTSSLDEDHLHLRGCLALDAIADEARVVRTSDCVLKS